MSSCKNTYCKDRIANSGIFTRVRWFLCKDLHRCIFSVKALSSIHFHQYYNCYDLVISDIIMPEITGFEFVTKIKEISPSVRALLMSASNANNFGKLSSITTVKVHVFIQKPISHEQFITIIVNLLKEE